AVEQRLERDGEANGRAVRQRQDEALPPPALTLLLDERQVRRQVDAGKRDRYVRLVAERGRRAHDGHGTRVDRLELARRLALDGGEDEVHPSGVEPRGVLEREAEELGRRLLAAPPSPRAARVADSLPVGAAGRARRGGEGRHLEPGMSGERGQELLTGDARGTHHRDGALPHRNGAEYPQASVLTQPRTTRITPTVVEAGLLLDARLQPVLAEPA